MLAASIADAYQDPGWPGVLVVSFALTSIVVRLVLCGLAAYGTRAALHDAGRGKEADSIRAHRLAVLREILQSLRPLNDRASESQTTHPRGHTHPQREDSDDLGTGA
jgi:hypothetical protein